MKIQLSKRELMVLKYLNSGEAKVYFGRLPLDYLRAKLNLSQSTTKDILNKLIEHNLVTTNEFGYPDKKTGYEITTEGESYLDLRTELMKEQKQERIIWNFIVPIIVSFITTVLTSLIIN